MVIGVEVYRKLLVAEMAKGELTPISTAAFVFLATAWTPFSLRKPVVRMGRRNGRVRSIFDRQLCICLVIIRNGHLVEGLGSTGIREDGKCI